MLSAGDLQLCVFVVGSGAGEGGPRYLFLKVPFLGEGMSSPAVLRLENEACVNSLRVWSGDCETRVQSVSKQVGGWGGQEPRGSGRRDPP